jgi:hypothetical protein
MAPVIRAVEPAACPSLTKGVRVRLRRHRRHDAADEDAHARARLHPGRFLAGEMEDRELSDDAVAAAVAQLPKVPA